MSSPVTGLDADLRRRMSLKHDPVMEQQAREWISTVLALDPPLTADVPLDQSLRDGVLLCRLLDKVTPGVKYNAAPTRISFKHMENINTFLAGAATVGCPASDLFQTIDLYEGKNVAQVVTAIHSFSRHAAAYSPGFAAAYPVLGPKLATKRVVSFTPEQLEMGKNVVNTFQYGFAGGATASGVYFGKRRDIGGKVETGRDVEVRRSSVSPPPAPSTNDGAHNVKPSEIFSRTNYTSYRSLAGSTASGTATSSKAPAATWSSSATTDVARSSVAPASSEPKEATEARQVDLAYLWTHGRGQ